MIDRSAAGKIAYRRESLKGYHGPQTVRVLEVNVTTALVEILADERNPDNVGQRDYSQRCELTEMEHDQT